MNEEFKIEVSRELGAIDSRLTNIERMLGDEEGRVKSLWIKFDRCRESHFIDDKNVIKKLYAISGMVSVVASILFVLMKKWFS